MHTSSFLRMAWFVSQYLGDQSKKRSVLDCGSCDVNGSYRPLFPAEHYSYQGLDLAPGPNVDIVCKNPYCWDSLADSSYDVIISGQAFEHIEFFWLTFSEIVRVLRPEGFICIIAPRFWSRHRYPVDCYRFDEDGMLALARYGKLEPLHVSMNMKPPEAPASWYDRGGDALLVARKPKDWKSLINPQEYVFEEADINFLHTGFVTQGKWAARLSRVRSWLKLPAKRPGLPK